MKKQKRKSSAWLLEYKRDVYSQSGEDGIIEKILNMLPKIDNWCVELGAWDGIHLSNTRNLIKNKGYSAVLIEANKYNFSNLQKYNSKNENIYLINQLVGSAKESDLDSILGDTPIPVDFDLLSIDVDGNDYHIWNALDKYEPKVVVIEFNPTIPNHIRFVQPSNPEINQGSSLLSIVELAKNKGYELVSVLPWNAFFVKNEYYKRFELATNEPEDLRTNLEHITYLFSGYDGRIFIRGNCKLPWHMLPLNESRIQHLPKFLQKQPRNYNILRKTVLRLHRLIYSPKKLKDARNLVNDIFRMVTKKFKNKI